jgi:hypothetical protein
MATFVCPMARHVQRKVALMAGQQMAKHPHTAKRAIVASMA